MRYRDIIYLFLIGLIFACGVKGPPIPPEKGIEPIDTEEATKPILSP